MNRCVYKMKRTKFPGESDPVNGPNPPGVMTQRPPTVNVTTKPKPAMTRKPGKNLIRVSTASQLASK